ncbi:MAG TPA: enoyl-CoA hydratase/isomerase family protein [Anaeromyxobacteraceae bacterium]|nr:enoyl-CoA hydratase/isomerase family protein [Anaeromyxobacteraceae bacterium]
MPFQSILADIRSPGVGFIRLNRPSKLNAISIEMRRELSECLDVWSDDPAVGAVVLTGEGRSFSAGYDLEEFRDPACHADLLESSSAYHRTVWHFPKPTIAAVNGLALGGGLDLATLCDLRLASENAWFARPELAHGAPPLFTPLRWIVGDGVARDLCLTRRRLTALDAQLVHLVSAVVAADDLLHAAIDLAVRVMAAPASALRFFKSRVTAGRALEFDEAFSAEHDRAFREVILPSGRWE